MRELPKMSYGSACLQSFVLGIFLCIAIPALGEETKRQVPSTAFECEIAKKRFLESPNPTSKDAEKFVDCFHVDITSGTISPIINEDHSESDENCIKGSEDSISECQASPRS